MKKKWVVAAVLCLAASLIVTGCSDSKDKDEDKETESTAEPVGANIKPLKEVREEMMKDIDKLVTLGQYKDVEVTVAKATVTDEQVQAKIDEELKYNAQPEQLTTGTVKDGDTVNIDYDGKVDGEALENGSDTGYNLEIGSNSFIPGFESGLIGKEAGSTFDINVTFPDPYENNEELSGKEAVFTVKINYIHGEKVIPELTDEWVVDLALDNVSTVDQYRDYIREQLQEEADEKKEQEIYNAVMEKILAASEIKDFAEDISLEDTKTEEIEYAKALADQNGYEYNDEFITLYTGGTHAAVESYEEALDEDIKNYYQRIMLYRAIAYKEDIDISEEDYEADVTELSKDYANYGMDSAADFEKEYSFQIYESDIYTAVEELILDAAIVTEE